MSVEEFTLIMSILEKASEEQKIELCLTLIKPHNMFRNLIEEKTQVSKEIAKTPSTTTSTMINNTDTYSVSEWPRINFVPKQEVVFKEYYDDFTTPEGMISLSIYNEGSYPVNINGTPLSPNINIEWKAVPGYVLDTVEVTIPEDIRKILKNITPKDIKIQISGTKSVLNY